MSTLKYSYVLRTCACKPKQARDFNLNNQHGKEKVIIAKCSIHRGYKLQNVVSIGATSWYIHFLFFVIGPTLEARGYKRCVSKKKCARYNLETFVKKLWLRCVQISCKNSNHNRSYKTLFDYTLRHCVELNYGNNTMRAASFILTQAKRVL